MSTQYPILYDRPINKWKVVELKEELKRRNLMTKGLKDDLIRRLNEAICNERASIDTEVHKDFDLSNKPLNEPKNSVLQAHSGEIDGYAEKKLNEVKVDNFVTGVYIAGGTSEVEQGKATDSSVSIPSSFVESDCDNPVDTSNKMDEHLSSPIASIDGPHGVFGNCGAAKENEDLRSAPTDGLGNERILEASGKSSDILSQVVDTQTAPNSTNLRNDEDVVVVSIAGSEKNSENYDVKLGNEYLKPSQMDAEFHVSYSSNQVSEINQNLGFQVQCESITTDSFSNLEKNEIKENLNSNNVELEPEVVRPEMVQPSSRKDPAGDARNDSLEGQMTDVKQGFVVEADDDKSIIKCSEKTDNADDGSAINNIMENRTLDDVADDNELSEVPFNENNNPHDIVMPSLPPQNMESSVKEKAEIAAFAEKRDSQDHLQADERSLDAKFSEMTDMTDGEPLEKINLDQSSADDSMEDEILEAREADSDFDPNKVGDKTNSNEATVVKAAGDIETSQADVPFKTSVSSHEDNDGMAASSEKRKFEVEAAPDNKELRKRQRRWNDESVKIPQQPSSDITLSTTSKAVLQSASTIPIIGLSNSAPGRDTTEQRIVPSSLKTPTSSLRIDHFVRPFTLKAVRELLSKTGAICNFWMDQIKTHCYVTYSSIEEAIETRNAVYNLQWPPYGGRLLIAEFVDPEEVKLHLEAPSQSASPVNSTSVLPLQTPAKKLAQAHQRDLRQNIELHPQQQATSDPPTARDWLPQARSPPAARIDPPIVTLDDLFRKTKATPRLYYLPLTDEQVAMKLNRQRK